MAPWGTYNVAVLNRFSSKTGFAVDASGKGGVILRECMAFNRLHPSNASIQKEVTLLPIVTEVKPVHFQKALRPMYVTLLGMDTEVKPLQPEKAPSSMSVTLPGMVTDVKPLQPEKAYQPT